MLTPWSHWLHFKCSVCVVVTLLDSTDRDYFHHAESHPDGGSHYSEILTPQCNLLRGGLGWNERNFIDVF